MEKLLLIVEDDEDLEFALADLATDRGYRTIGARDGVEALEVLGRVRPFAMILDLMMPRMNGYDLMDRMRADPKLADIPVLVVTAGLKLERPLPADVPVFKKPIDRKALVRAIEACAPGP